MGYIFDQWMQEVLKTNDLHEAAIIVWNMSEDMPTVKQHENNLYGAQIGRRGHGLGITEDEAVVHAAWDAYFRPLMRGFEDLLYMRMDALKDLNQAQDTMAQEEYDAAVAVIDAHYQEKRAALLREYPVQVGLITRDKGEG